MDLAALQQQLQHTDLAPVESWQPPFCGDIPIHIDAEANWHYQGSKIQRPALVKLFASVLLQQHGEYFLQTPVEKVRISVADAPFLVTDWCWQGTDTGPALQLTTNLQHQLVVSPRYPLLMQADPQQQHLPYLQLWRGLKAKLSRNVYYQLAEQTSAVSCNRQLHYQLKSAGYPFSFAICNADTGR
uniref:FIG003620: Proteophosphoglycan n=1 Tax=Rheinheimera sp. BAL341 TaxID=1708203 RepID=A0A486XU12_9GAMM